MAFKAVFASFLMRCALHWYTLHIHCYTVFVQEEHTQHLTQAFITVQLRPIQLSGLIQLRSLG